MEFRRVKVVRMSAVQTAKRRSGAESGMRQRISGQDFEGALEALARFLQRLLAGLPQALSRALVVMVSLELPRSIARCERRLCLRCFRRTPACRSDEPVAAPRKGCDVPGLLGVISQRRADFPNAEIERVFEVHVDIGVPELLTDGLAGDQPAGAPLPA